MAFASYSYFTGKDEIITAIADDVIDTITATADAAFLHRLGFGPGIDVPTFTPGTARTDARLTWRAGADRVQGRSASRQQSSGTTTARPANTGSYLPAAIPRRHWPSGSLTAAPKTSFEPRLSRRSARDFLWCQSTAVQGRTG